MDYIYYNEDGDVKMISEGEIIVSKKLKFFKKKLTKAERKNIADINVSVRVKNNKLILI